MMFYIAIIGVNPGTFLVVRWAIDAALPMQRARVHLLVRKLDPTYCS